MKYDEISYKCRNFANLWLLKCILNEHSLEKRHYKSSWYPLINDVYLKIVFVNSLLLINIECQENMFKTVKYDGKRFIESVIYEIPMFMHQKDTQQSVTRS